MTVERDQFLRHSDAACICRAENRLVPGLPSPSECPKHGADVAAGRRAYCCASEDVLDAGSAPHLCIFHYDEMNRDMARRGE